MRPNLSETYPNENEAFLISKNPGLHIVETFAYTADAVSELDAFVESDEVLEVESESAFEEELDLDLVNEERDRADDHSFQHRTRLRRFAPRRNQQIKHSIAAAISSKRRS